MHVDVPPLLPRISDDIDDVDNDAGVGFVVPVDAMQVRRGGI